MKKAFLTSIIVLAVSAYSFSQKFAVVDSKYILEYIPEYNSAQEKIDAMSVEWQKEIEAKFADIDKMYKAYQNESVLLPEDMKKKRQDEIFKKEKEAKDLQKQRFGKDGDIFKRRQDLIKPIQDKVYSAIEKVAKSGNYLTVFDKSGTITMIYVDPKVDISDQVLSELGYK